MFRFWFMVRTAVFFCSRRRFAPHFGTFSGFLPDAPADGRFRSSCPRCKAAVCMHMRFFRSFCPRRAEARCVVGRCPFRSGCAGKGAYPFAAPFRPAATRKRVSVSGRGPVQGVQAPAAHGRASRWPGIGGCMRPGFLPVSGRAGMRRADPPAVRTVRGGSSARCRRGCRAAGCRSN